MHEICVRLYRSLVALLQSSTVTFKSLPILKFFAIASVIPFIAEASFASIGLLFAMKPKHLSNSATRSKEELVELPSEAPATCGSKRSSTKLGVIKLLSDSLKRILRHCRR